REQLAREPLAVARAGLGEAGGEAHEPPRAPPREPRRDARDLARGSSDESGIGRGGKLLDRAKVALLRARGARRMYAPYLPRVADPAARRAHPIPPRAPR